jgi:hypothetical protein
MSTINYLLDENVDHRLRTALHQHWPEMAVWIVGDPATPKRGTPDPDILVWCEAHDFILITNNRASIPVHLQHHLAAGRHIPGIFVLNPNLTIGETADELALIWATSEPTEYLDLLTYLPVS